MQKSILFVLTSQDALGATGIQTGSWLEELAAAYYALVDGGSEVRLASVRGGQAPLDPASLEEPWLTDAGKRFLGDVDAMAAVQATLKMAKVDPEDHAAIYCVGGAGAAWDFPDDADIRRTVEGIGAKGGVIAGVCHGVLGLTSAETADGVSVIAGRKVTAVSNIEEELTTFDKVVPVLPENRLVALQGLYSKAAEPFGAHLVVDGNLITGQNPASAGLVGQAILEKLTAQPNDA